MFNSWINILNFLEKTNILGINLNDYFNYHKDNFLNEIDFAENIIPSEFSNKIFEIIFVNSSSFILNFFLIKNITNRWDMYNLIIKAYYRFKMNSDKLFEEHLNNVINENIIENIIN